MTKIELTDTLKALPFDQLRQICHQMGREWGQLAGFTKVRKVKELIGLAERYGVRPELEQLVNKLA